MSGRRDAALTIALRSYQAQRFEPARRACQDVLKENHQDPVALHLLGLIAFSENQLDVAISHMVAAAAIEPDSIEIRTNLGLAFRTAGRLDAAEEQFRLALSLKPDDSALLNELALTLIDQGEMDKAQAILDRAIALAPGRPDLRNSLGIYYLRQKNYDQAVKALTKALELDPDFAEAHLNMGVVLREMGQPMEAVPFLSAVAGMKPNNAEIAVQLGVTLKEVGKTEDAHLCFDRAVSLDPNHADAQNNYGNSLVEQGRPSQAEKVLRKALTLRPGFAEAMANLGVALHHQGRVEEALETFDAALEIDPDLADAHWNRAFSLLMLGDYSGGWDEYEWRWTQSRFQAFKRDSVAPRWDGVIDPGKTLLLHGEQGFGDMIHFARYAQLPADQGMRVVLEVHSSLQRLFTGLWEGVEVVTFGQDRPPIDVQAPLISLPGILGKPSPEDMPVLQSYITAETTLSDKWADSLRGKPGLTVGLCWQGSPGNAMDHRRSLPLEVLLPLRDMDGVRLVCLQKGAEARQQIEETGFVFDADIGGGDGDFAETAALITNLDVVVSVDTVIAHLAGAMGLQVIAMLARVACWRYGREGDISPWYPTMTLQRQTEDGDWAPVIAQVVKDLERLKEKP